MERVPKLLVVEGERSGERFALGEVGLVIGRPEPCAIRVQDPGVSREHAEVLLRNSTVWVQDRGSRNGVFVNGKRINRPKTLGVGDRLVVGEHTFELELNPDEGDGEAVTELPPASAEPAPPQAEPPVAGSSRGVFLVAGLVVLLLLGVAVALSVG